MVLELVPELRKKIKTTVINKFKGPKSIKTYKNQTKLGVRNAKG